MRTISSSRLKARSLSPRRWAQMAARKRAEVLIEKAKVLDSFYIPTRYANGHPEGAPFEHYGTIQSKDGIRYAGEIIEFVRIQMA